MAKHIGHLQGLHILKVTLHQDLEIGTLEIVSPLIQCFDNRQNRPIIHVIVPFDQGAPPSASIHCSNDPESVVLADDAGDCEAGWIGLQTDLFWRVGMVETR